MKVKVLPQSLDAMPQAAPKAFLASPKNPPNMLQSTVPRKSPTDPPWVKCFTVSFRTLGMPASGLGNENNPNGSTNCNGLPDAYAYGLPVWASAGSTLRNDAVTGS